MSSGSRVNSRMGVKYGVGIVGAGLFAGSLMRPILNDESATKTETSEEGKEEDKEAKAEDYEGAAYNPVTGEINWDCPCLGGMADGPCGEEFKEAFACFVYSETEPKGIDCIKKFEAMRTCFRRYPEHYKDHLEEDDEAGEVGTGAGEAGEVGAGAIAAEAGEAVVIETPEAAVVDVVEVEEVTPVVVESPVAVEAAVASDPKL